MVFNSVDAVTGSGKTYAACDFAASLLAVNFAFVMPTRRLIKTTVAAFRQRHPAIKHRISVFHSDVGNKPVTGRIADHLLKTPPDAGSIIFLTHEALARVPHWHSKGAWHVIIDEALATTYSETYTLAENRGKLLEVMVVRRDEGIEGYLRVEPSDSHGIKAVARNKHKDQITALFRCLASKLIDSSYWHLFVEAGQYERFVEGEVHQLELHGLLHLTIFDGFASVTFMAANLKQTMMYHHLSAAGYTFRPHMRIVSQLRYNGHHNGTRLRILYLSDRSWSKAMRDTEITQDGETVAIGELYLQLIRERFADQPYLWIGNKDLPDDALDGTRLPNVPHGLNTYQGFHRCAIVSSLRPTPAHGAFLRAMANIDERQVRRALLSEVSYQACGRGSLRNPAADEPFELIVPDKGTADDVAELYPGCSIGPLLCPDAMPSPKKRGRPQKHETPQQADKVRNRRRKWRKELLARIDYLSASAEQMSPDPDRTRSPIVQVNSVYDARSTPGFICSLWRRVRTKWWESQRLMSTDDMYATLRDHFANNHSVEKSDGDLISTTWYETQGEGHNYDNALFAKGVVLDIDHADMTPGDLAKMLPDTEMLCVSSWSHQAGDIRYRVYIPTTTAMPPESVEVITKMIRQRCRNAGWHDKGLAGRKHGINDPSTLQAASLFYLPSRREGGFLIEHRENRLPIDPAEWIRACPAEVVDSIIGMVEPATDVHVEPTQGEYSERQQDGFADATTEWRSHSKHDGNRAFHRLAWRWCGYGMMLGDIEAKLKDEAVHAHKGSVDDRVTQIPYIMDDIRKRSTYQIPRSGRLLPSHRQPTERAGL